MFTDNVIPEKINFIPHQIQMTSNYNENMAINSSFKQLIYQPDFYNESNSVRFIINSNGFLDPYSLNLMFTVKVNDPNSWYQFDNSAHSIIEKLIISCNGVELERIENYQYLNSILFDVGLDLESRRHLEHHGFGYENRDEIAFGTGEDCFPETNVTNYDEDQFFKINKYRPTQTVTIKGGVPDYSNFDKSKTYILPLMSFIFGMNVSEYKYIPLHLFPYLQIEIVFNKYAIFKRTHRDIYFKNYIANDVLKNKKDFYESKLLNLLAFYFESARKAYDDLGIKYDFDFFKACKQFKDMMLGITSQDKIFLDALVKLEKGKQVPQVFDRNSLLDSGLKILKLMYPIGYIGGGISSHGFMLEVLKYVEKIQKYKIFTNENNDISELHTENSNIYVYKNENETISSVRDFTISPKLYLLTEQLFFEISDHYRIINSINTFSIITSGFDTQKFDFNEYEKPNEYVTVNFPRKSIRKFMSCFYSKEYIIKPHIRQLARYSKDIVKYNVRIGVNTYPQLQLNGITSFSSLENQNNMLFLNELFKSFEQDDYGTINKGIINSKNYAINFQTSDTILKVNELSKPFKIMPLEHEVVGRSIVCLRTNKLAKTLGVFTGENNSTGSDIVRYINQSTENGIQVKGNFFEMIIVEYDLIFVVEGIGRFKIIR
jgi:hypothetical protein